MSSMQWWRGPRSASEPVDADAWGELRRLSPLIAAYPPSAQPRLRDLCGAFLGSKTFEGAHGLDVDHETRLLIAAQACVPVLGLSLDWLDDWQTVIVYPGDFIAHREFVDEAGVVHESDDPLSGEAWGGGPLVLSLERVREDAEGLYWGNVVVHEIAHKLDLRNGVANGMPPLHGNMSRKRWTEIWTAAFEALDAEFEQGVESWVDEQALEDAGEFFAIMSEAFFTCPVELRRRHADLYSQLEQFYRQDPLTFADTG